MKLDTIDLPPVEDAEGGEGREEWSVRCWYEGSVVDEERRRVIDTIDTSAAFMHIIKTDEYVLALRARGHMDEAVASAVVSLKGIKGIVTNAIRTVDIVSLADISFIKDEWGNAFDITRSVKAALE